MRSKKTNANFATLKKCHVHCPMDIKSVSLIKFAMYKFKLVLTYVSAITHLCPYSHRLLTSVVMLLH